MGVVKPYTVALTMLCIGVAVALTMLCIVVVLLEKPGPLGCLHKSPITQVGIPFLFGVPSAVQVPLNESGLAHAPITNHEELP